MSSASKKGLTLNTTFFNITFFRTWLATIFVLFSSRFPIVTAFCGKVSPVASNLRGRHIPKINWNQNLGLLTFQQDFRNCNTRLSRTMSNEATNSSSKSHKVAVHWFRNGLRLHDNRPLLDACQNSETLLPLYIIDPDAPFAQTPNRKAGAIRANFILEAIQEMNRKLQKQDSRLVVLLGKPDIVLPKVMNAIDATALYYEREPAEPIRMADAKVLENIDSSKVEIIGYDTHTLHPMEHYLTKCKGHVAPSSYGAFTKIFNQLGPVPCEVETVKRVPSLPPLLSNMTVGKEEVDGDASLYMDCPPLERLGYDPKALETRFKSGIDFYGGEDAGLKLLNHMMKRTKWVCEFEKPKTSPNALKVDTTGLSACKLRLSSWIMFGLMIFPKSLPVIYDRCKAWVCFAT